MYQGICIVNCESKAPRPQSGPSARERDAVPGWAGLPDGRRPHVRVKHGLSDSCMFKPISAMKKLKDRSVPFIRPWPRWIRRACSIPPRGSGPGTSLRNPSATPGLAPSLPFPSLRGPSTFRAPRPVREPTPRTQPHPLEAPPDPEPPDVESLCPRPAHSF